tara:strand:+ start:44 stop:553 length:510 start_codon:yes stop_codon:yes gene_type:complete
LYDERLVLHQTIVLSLVASTEPPPVPKCFLTAAGAIIIVGAKKSSAEAKHCESWVACAPVLRHDVRRALYRTTTTTHVLCFHRTEIDCCEQLLVSLHPQLHELRETMRVHPKLPFELARFQEVDALQVQDVLAVQGLGVEQATPTVPKSRVDGEDSHRRERRGRRRLYI